MQTDFPVPEESQNTSKSQNKQMDAMKKKKSILTTYFQVLA